MGKLIPNQQELKMYHIDKENRAYPIGDLITGVAILSDLENQSMVFLF